MANPEHIKLLKQRIELWNQWRIEHPQIVPDLSGAELSKANLNRANLNQANLNQTNLSGASLSYASLRDADLRGANLSGASFSGTDLSNTQIDGKTAIHAKWRLVWTIVNQGARGKNLRAIDLRGANLRNTDLRGADLSRADLSEAELTKADLSQARLANAFLNGADLRGANLTGADLKGANLTGADLKGAGIAGADVRDANLTSTILKQTQAPIAVPKTAHFDSINPEESKQTGFIMAHYLIAEYDSGRQKVLLDGPKYLIGRDAKCDIRLPSKFVSRCHARLVRLSKEDGSVYYQILDGAPNGKPSVNGLLINGRKLTSWDLQSGDEIVFGPQVRAIYYMQKNTPASLKASARTTVPLTESTPEETEDPDKVTLRVSSEVVQEVIDYLKKHHDPAANQISDRLEQSIEPE